MLKKPTNTQGWHIFLLKGPWNTAQVVALYTIEVDSP